MALNRFSRRCFHGLAISAVLRAASPDRKTILLLSEKEFADVFDPEVQKQIRANCSSIAKSLAGSTNAVAYVFSEIPPWTRAWVDWFRARHADSAGKQQYVQFLKETYSYSISDVNNAYGIDSTSFTDLGQFNWKAAKLSGERPRSDDEEFLGWIAQALFGPVIETIRKTDPSHKILGQQFGPDTPKSVLRASAKLLDVARAE